MAQYFFKMSQAEKNDILDKHKTIYDGYVTEYGQQPNTQPLYVQDFANDKLGITVNNKGEVMPYTNMNINESIGLDMIGDGPTDLKNGTVDLDGQSDEDNEYISLGLPNEDEDPLGNVINFDELGEEFEYDIDRDFEEDLTNPMNYEVTGDSFEDEVDEEEMPDFMEKLNESLDMFKRFKKYN